MATNLSGASAQGPQVEPSPPPPPPQNFTRPSDKEALLEIKERLGNQSRIQNSLNSWVAESDPCVDGWDFIRCTCAGLTRDNPELIEYCDNYTQPRSGQRVIFVRMEGGTEPTEKLTGKIPSAFGKLSKLRVLDLSKNAFTGTIPRAFRRLRKLRFLNLADNQLNGTIPRFLGRYRRLQRLELGDNKFKGKIPEKLCRDIPSDVRIVLLRNPGLCGRLPTCLNTSVNDLNGTYAFSQSIPESFNNSGVCDETPPECNPSRGCQIFVPQYWTRDDFVEFNFTNFTDPDSNVTSHTLRLLPEPLPESESIGEEATESIASIIITNMVPQITENVTRLIGRENITLLMNTVRQSLSGSGQLVNGAKYQVNIEASNNAGPPLTSAPIPGGWVLVDTEKPVIGTPIYNTKDFEEISELEIGSKIGVSWNSSFTDGESGVDYIIIQFEQETIDENGTRSHTILNETRRDENPDKMSIEYNIPREELEIDKKYRFQVIVFDKAGQNQSDDSSSFIIIKGSSDWFEGVNLWLVICMAVLVFALGCLTAGVILPMIRSKQRRASFDRNEYLKALTYKLIDASEDELRAASDPILEQAEIAFVVTDVEASTQQSLANEAAFKQLTDIHDMIMRDTYDAYKGYEIQTEGDSFQLAFSSTASAVRFCLDVQRNLLDFKWSAEILRLPYCALRKDVRGGVSFRGPRVRMAIHWARETVVTNRVHPSTMHMIFEGPAFNVAKELCDNASGGQILMTHDAWMNFLDHFPSTGFPTVEQLGSYRLQNWPEKMWIYDISQRIGKPIFRTFPCLRKVEAATEGAGLDIIPPPDPDEKRMLTFVAIKSEPELKRMPLQMDKTFMELLRLHGQHFQAHLFRVDREEGIVIFAFHSAINALRYCHIIQVSAVLQYWPSDHLAICLPSVPGSTPLPIPLFHGPRISAAVHSTKRFETVYVQQKHTTHLWNSEFSGHGVSFVSHLVKVTNPGQIIFSGATWAPIQNTMPPESQCLSLGRHIIDDHYAHPVRLFELLPNEAEGREFPDLATKRRIDLGYRNAPSIEKDVVIVFVKGHKPELVRKYEERREIQNIPESEIQALIAAYYESLTLFVAIVRHRLKKHGGYECKEPEMGKFTLAFHDLSSAIRWACHIHAELLRIDWPMRLLELDECQEKWHENRILIHRGLGVKIGMAYGKAGQKKPLITGRADYFGSLANVAARVMALARPGQVMIHSGTGFVSEEIEWIDQNYGILKFEKPLTFEEDGVDEVAIEISKMGMFLLRGVNELKLIFQAQPASVAVSGRFGEMDVASLYTTDNQRLSTVSRLWSNIRNRNPLKSARDNLSCFLSNTNQNKLDNSPHSASTNASTVQETSALLKSSSSSRPPSTSRPRPSHSGDQLPGLDPAAPPDVCLQIEMTEQISPRSSDSEPVQPEGALFQGLEEEDLTRPIQTSMKSERGTNPEGKFNTLPQQIRSANSDELVVSIGDQSIPRVLPLSKLQGLQESDDEETQSPSEIGKKLASLYSNAGMAGSSTEFSFPREVTGDGSSNRGQESSKNQMSSHPEHEDEEDSIR